jgi:hypothetical protein
MGSSSPRTYRMAPGRQGKAADEDEDRVEPGPHDRAQEGRSAADQSGQPEPAP